MRESKSLLKLLQMDLEAHPPQAATQALSLILKPVHPRTIQAGIFLPVTPAPDKLELTLARIRGIVGEDKRRHPRTPKYAPPPSIPTVQAPATNHQPPAANPASQAFRYFRPPLQRKNRTRTPAPHKDHRPRHNGKVINAAGPWRTTGDWWTATPWNRDEWDITLSTSVLYRIYREPDQHWFIEGTYD